MKGFKESITALFSGFSEGITDAETLSRLNENRDTFIENLTAIAETLKERELAEAVQAKQDESDKGAKAVVEAAKEMITTYLNTVTESYEENSEIFQGRAHYNVAKEFNESIKTVLNEKGIEYDASSDAVVAESKREIAQLQSELNKSKSEIISLQTESKTRSVDDVHESVAKELNLSEAQISRMTDTTGFGLRLFESMGCDQAKYRQLVVTAASGIIAEDAKPGGSDAENVTDTTLTESGSETPSAKPEVTKPADVVKSISDLI